MTTLPRADAAEWMDEPEVDPAQLVRSLADLRRVNRWLGGTRLVVHYLKRMLGRLPPGTYRVLDVATGSADVPLALVRWARRRGRSLRIVATDLHAGTLTSARQRTAGEPAVSVVPADALALPFADGAFHFALCSTALHHFPPAQAVQVLRELGRVAEYGVIVNDLRRSRAGLLGARLLAATFWRWNPITRHDGPLSVRRAYTAAELRDLARQAGLHDARVRHHPVFRVALVVVRRLPPMQGPAPVGGQ